MPVLFGLPVVSILLFIFAGVLIGHLIWYHDHRADAGKIRELEDKYAKANGSANTNKSEFMQLKQSLARQASDSEQIRLSHEEIQNKYNKAQTSAQQAEAELKKLRREHAAAIQKKNEAESLNSRNTDVTREAAGELARQSKLIDELKAANKQYLSQIDSLQDSLKQQRVIGGNVTKQQQTIVELQDEVETQQQSKQQMQIALDAAQREIQSNTEQRESLKQELAASVQQSQAAEQRSKQLEEDLKVAAGVQAERDEVHQKYESVSGSVVQLQEQLSDFSDKIQKAESVNKSLLDDVQQKSEQIDQLEEQVRDMSPLKDELNKATAALDQQMSKAQQQLQIASQHRDEIAQLRLMQGEFSAIQSEKEDLVNELTESKQVNDSLRQSLVEKAQEVDTLQNSQTAAEEQIKLIKIELDKTAGSFSETTAENSRIKSALWQKQNDVKELQKHLEAAETIKAELTESAKKLAQMKSENETVRSKTATQQNEIARLKSELQKLDDLQQKLAGSEQAVISLKAQSQQQTKAFAEQRTEIQQLKSQLTDFESTKQQFADASTQLAAMNAEREKISAQHVEYQQEIKKLTTQLAVHTNNVEDLQRQLATKTKAYKDVAAESREATQKLRGQASLVQKLQGQIAASEKLRPENQSLQAQVKDLTAHLKRLSAELEDSLQANTKIQGRIRQLENQAHDDANTIRELRRDRGSIDGLDQDQRKAA